MPTISHLELLADTEGRVHLGWLASGVLYARFEGGVTAELGARFATRLGVLVAQVSGVRYFADARALTYYDLLARSAFVRVVLANRRRFTSLVMLTWVSGISAAARNMTITLGGSVELLSDRDEFDRRLTTAAPLARQVLASNAGEAAVPPRQTVNTKNQ